MRVLLSGSTGFIGSAVGAALRARGDEVVPLVRSAARPGEALVDLEAGAIDAVRAAGGSLEGIDAAIHLAGAPIIGRWTARRREAIRVSRIAVGNLLARTLAALTTPPTVLVSGSAIGYYGDGGEVELDEASASGAGFLPEVCRAWEASTAPAREAGIRTALIRTGIVLGPGGGALAPQLRLFRLGLGGRLGSGRQWMSVISLADEVRVILRAIDDGFSGPINATSPTPLRNREFTATLARAVGRPAPLAVPAAALRLALGAGPANEMLLASQRVLPRRLLELGFEFEHPDAAAAIAWAVGGS
ncbi:MAG TPA: TIGR01777 family oxidoreductase [Acidimicrobiales bacterium]|nr:TIGR01777 family oxidoreductase [Acidimicrobiales bacterium]